MQIKLLRTHPFAAVLYPNGKYPPHRPVNAMGVVGKTDARFVDVPKGTVIDAKQHPGLKDIWRLCRLGVAVPNDKECEEKCAMTNEQIAAAAVKYDLMDRAQATGDPAIDASGAATQ